MQVAPGAIVDNLMKDFNIDATKFGFLSACFYYAYTPLQLISGLLLDRYSIKIILICATTICSAGVLLFACTSNFYIASLARFIIGGTSACSFISVLQLIIRWIPPCYFALFAGIVEMTGSFGGILGSKPFAVLLKYFDWHIVTMGFALFGFLLAILIAFVVQDQPKNLTPTSPTFNQNFIYNNLKIISYNRETWVIGIYSFFIWAPVISWALWGASFLQSNCNLDHLTATLAVAYAWLGIALASPLIGLLSDLIARRCIIMSTCAIIGLVVITILIFVTNMTSNLLNILTFLLGCASAGQTLSFALIKDNNSSHTIGTANGFNNMCVVASGILFPILIGKILDLNWQGMIQNNIKIYSIYGYRIAFMILPLCYFISSLISIFGIKETYCLTNTKERCPRG
ncbi:MAG: MFS transporter [Coxiellaceae bacterium]|nr:MFS transporter [Coxiellaceae bacterium]